MQQQMTKTKMWWAGTAAMLSLSVLFYFQDPTAFTLDALPETMAKIGAIVAMVMGATYRSPANKPKSND